LFVVKQTLMKISFVMLFVIVTRLKSANAFNASRRVYVVWWFCDYNAFSRFINR
jgi:hypothetical protein